MTDCLTESSRWIAQQLNETCACQQVTLGGEVWHYADLLCLLESTALTAPTLEQGLEIWCEGFALFGFAWYPQLSRGDLNILAEDSTGAGIFAYSRKLDNAKALVILNTADQPIRLNRMTTGATAGSNVRLSLKMARVPDNWAPTIAVDKANRTINFDFPSASLGRPASLDGIQFYVTTWDLDGLSSSYRPLNTTAGPWNFSGGTSQDPLIWDDLPLISLSESD